MPITNACFCVVVDPCNATNDNAYKSVGVDLSNGYMDIWQHIDALLKGGSCCSGTKEHTSTKERASTLRTIIKEHTKQLVLRKPEAQAH